MFKFKVHIDFEPEREEELLKMYDDGTLLKGAKGFELAKMDLKHDSELNRPYYRICGRATPLLAVKSVLASKGIGDTGFRLGW